MSDNVVDENRKRRKNKFLFFFLSLPFVFGIFFLTVAFFIFNSKLKLYEQANNWPTVNARLIDKQIRAFQRTKGDNQGVERVWCADYFYEYELNGKKFKSTKAINVNCSNSENETKSIAASRKIGEITNVFVNTKNPTEIHLVDDFTVEDKKNAIKTANNIERIIFFLSLVVAIWWSLGFFLFRKKPETIIE